MSSLRQLALAILQQQTKLESTGCLLQICSMTPLQVAQKLNPLTSQSHAGLLSRTVVSLGVLSKSQSHLQKICNILQHTNLQSWMKCEGDTGYSSTAMMSQIHSGYRRMLKVFSAVHPWLSPSWYNGLRLTGRENQIFTACKCITKSET